MSIIRTLKVNLEAKLTLARANKAKRVVERTRKNLMSCDNEPWYIKTDKDLAKLEAINKIEKEVTDAFVRV